MIQLGSPVLTENNTLPFSRTTPPARPPRYPPHPQASPRQKTCRTPLPTALRSFWQPPSCLPCCLIAPAPSPTETTDPPPPPEAASLRPAALSKAHPALAPTYTCQRRFKNVRKRRSNFVVFRRSHGTAFSVSLLKKCVHNLLLLRHKSLSLFQPVGSPLILTTVQ